jgi:predicted Zn-dependent protease
MIQNQFNGLYFDGQSSQAQPVTLKFHEQQHVIYLQFASGEIQKWDYLQTEVFDGPGQVEIRLTSGSSVFVRLELTKAQQHYIHRQLSSNNWHFGFAQLGLAKILFVALVLFSGLIASYFWLLPPLAEKAVDWLPTSIDQQIGDTFFASIVDAQTIDQKRSVALNNFAAELKLRNHMPLHFNVVHSDEVNAFALPNGEIVVYTGLLRQIKTPAQLVALLGHEVSHINERHSMKLLSQNLAGYMIISLLIGDISGISSVLIDNAQQLQQLSYSRNNEQQADELGFQILLDNKQDPKGMSELFGILKKQEFAQIPELLSSHPLTNSRIAYIRKKQARFADTQPEPNQKLEQWFEILVK